MPLALMWGSHHASQAPHFRLPQITTRDVSSLLGRGRVSGWGIPTLYRINDNIPYGAVLPQLEYSNKFRVAIPSKQKSAPQDERRTFPDLTNIISDAERANLEMLGSNIFPDLTKTWRIMAEIKTSHGPIIVRIPMLDENVQEVIKACQG